jgi:hypothetical protein
VADGVPPNLAPPFCIDAEGWLTVLLLTLRHLEYLSTAVGCSDNEKESSGHEL